ncbi:MAG: hypothetical protein ACPHOK_07410 [Akkermansiaceae bacterium]
MRAPETIPNTYLIRLSRRNQKKDKAKHLKEFLRLCYDHGCLEGQEVFFVTWYYFQVIIP